MKQILTGTISIIIVATLLLITGGCAQKTVQTEPLPSSAPVTAQITPPPPVTTTIQPVERPFSEQEPRPQSQSTSRARSQPVTEEPMEESAPRSESLDTAMAAVGQTGLDSQTQASALGTGRSSASLLSIYFDFDRFSIREDQIAHIRNNATILKQETALRVRIEGNSDERGTNEYNMALGERRAMVAKQYLIDLGIDENRLETLSYGEERPLNPDHDEVAWAQNRRGDFVILN